MAGTVGGVRRRGQLAGLVGVFRWGGELAVSICEVSWRGQLALSVGRSVGGVSYFVLRFFLFNLHFLPYDINGHFLRMLDVLS